MILAPSSPVASLEPILGLPGIRSVLAAVPVVAITPVVSGRPPATPPEQSRARVRAAFMAAAGLDHSATAVATLYADFADAFVAGRARLRRDRRDRAPSDACRHRRHPGGGAGRVRLAETVLAATAG